MAGTPGRWAFGEFEIDAARYELARRGDPVHLERIPMELLLLLVERRGQLVTRGEIAERLWGRGVALEIAQGVHTAIRKVRAALGDDPDAPRFVATVVGKGYRFDGEVVALPPAPGAPAGEAPGAAAPRVPEARPPRTVAVLPLENLSGDDDEEYFADGVTDALITQLARLRGLAVISRTSSMAWKRARRPLPEIARALGADAVVEGTVARGGGRVRITVQLVDGATDRHLWAESYERDLRDVLAAQAEVTRNVARRVLDALSPEDAARLAPGAAVDPAAYDAHLRGRALWGRRDEASLVEAVARFERAVELDPGFAAAWSGLADACAALGYTSLWPPGDAFPRAEGAALRALELDPGLGEAHASLAYCRLYHGWDWAAAEEGFRRAIALDPGAVTAHHWYSVFLAARGRAAEARAAIARARRLDPLSVAIQTDVGFELYYAGRHAEAAAHLRAVLRTSPGFPLAHLWLGRAHEALGAWDDAVAELRQAERALPEWPVAVAALGHALGRAGRGEEARAALARLGALATRRYVTPYGVALVHAGLGDADEALRWLRRAIEDRSHWLVWLALDPRFADLRLDPRFGEIAARVGL